MTNFLQEEECEEYEDGHDSSHTEYENAPIPLFLIGEEKKDEAGLSDGKSIFVDDVLKNAERCVLLKYSVYPHSEHNLRLGRSHESYHTTTLS